MPTVDIALVGKTLFKLAVLGTFIAAMIAFFNWYIQFFTDLYQKVYPLVTELSEVIVGGKNITDSKVLKVILCVMSVLKIDIYIQSSFSISYTAVLFWVTAVGYMIAYKLGSKIYSGALKL